MNRSSIVTTVAALSALAASAANADQITLEDANSSAIFDTAAGQIDWQVDSVSNLFDQSFWFRRGTDTREYQVNDQNLNLEGFFASDTNPFIDSRNDTFAALYNDGNGLEIETTFTLRGGNAGSGQSSLSELISFTNTSSNALTLSIFQYVNMDLGGDFGDDSAVVIDGNTVQQFDDVATVSETVVTPAPTQFQVGTASSLIAALSDGDIDNLDGTAAAGPTDIAWAFQWDITLGAGESILISKEKTIVPTPGSLAMIGFGTLVATRRRR